MEPKRSRRATAVLLSLLYPGLGHAYVRSWHRALVWYLAGVGVFLAISPDVFSNLLGAQSLDAMVQASRQVSVETLAVVVLAVRVFGMADVWWLLRRRTSDGSVHCDACGRERDPAVEFCPWCLDESGQESAPSLRR